MLVRASRSMADRDRPEAWAAGRDLRHRPARRDPFRRTAHDRHLGTWRGAHALESARQDR